MSFTGTPTAGAPTSTVTPPAPGTSLTVTFTAEVSQVFPAGPLTVQIGLAPYPDPQQPVGQNVVSASASGYTWAISWMLLSLIVFVVLVALVLWLMQRRRLRSRLDRAMLAAREEALTEKSTVAGGAKS